jgi:hypothetical protein
VREREKSEQARMRVVLWMKRDKKGSRQRRERAMMRVLLQDEERQKREQRELAMKVLLRNKAATGACNEIKGFNKSTYINFLPPGARKLLNGSFLCCLLKNCRVALFTI